MGVRTIEFDSFGGCDTRSSPLRVPMGRALRCKNWAPNQAGDLVLRNSYTSPTMSAVDTSSAIHSAFYFQKHNDNQYILFSQGTALKAMQLGAAGTVSALATLSDSMAWNGVFAFNRFFLSNGTDFKYWDGVTLRNVGIREPQNTESTSVSLVVSTASGSFTATVLSGYQLWMAFYNPSTGMVGNGATISSRFTISGSTNQLVLSNLPDLSGVDTEWVKVFGRTNDNGEVPYIFVDTSGNYIVAANAATGTTLTSPVVDFNSEVPVRNTQPTAMRYLAYCLGRMFGIDEADPHNVAYSEAEFDDVAASFVGRPEQAWPASNRLPFPTGERCIGIHENGGEIWVWSRNHLGILTEFGGFSGQGGPTMVWKAIHVGGLANHRAFCKTPYGPAWLSADKELMTMGANGPIPVSDEYAGLLAQISDANLGAAEIIYLRDPQLQIDRLYILGRDGSDDPVIVVHDFKLRDQQSPFGQAYEFLYTGMIPKTFVRSPQSVISLRDTNDRPRLWAGSEAGRFHQLEDGAADGVTGTVSGTFTADYITIVNWGLPKPMIAGIEFQGDTASVWYASGNDLSMDEDDLDALQPLEVSEENADEARYRAGIEDAAQYMVLRVKLVSHPVDGDLTLSDLLHFPLETYGRILVGRGETGRVRPEGGRNP